MIESSPRIKFEILIDDTLIGNNPSTTLSSVSNKRILSIVNDYEEEDWRYKKFEKFIWDNLAETSLSYRERESLIGQDYTRLIEAAKNLRISNDYGSGSEISEILLYGIMKHHYNALPVVPKIFYKQNSQDNAKGADSVHIVLEEGNDFSIWFGESKFYSSIDNDRLSSIVTSVENSLQKEKIKKENSIITNLNEIDLLITDEPLNKNIKAFLSNDESIDKLKPKLNIPILLLHECSITKINNDFTELYIDEIKKYHTERTESYFKKQIDKFGTLHKYSEITFHLILFPVPEKEPIVSSFIAKATAFKS